MPGGPLGFMRLIRVGILQLNIPSLPKLRDVLIFDGLKANLVSINQLCDQDLFVKFTKDKCIVVNRD